MSNQIKTPIITCPHCKAQYLPCEIYMPEYVFGKVDDLVKDPEGRIIYTDYQENWEPDNIEHYVCDFCNKPFVIEASMSFKTKAEKEELDFSNLETSLI